MYAFFAVCLFAFYVDMSIYFILLCVCFILIQLQYYILYWFLSNLIQSLHFPHISSLFCSPINWLILLSLSSLGVTHAYLLHLLFFRFYFYYLSFPSHFSQLSPSHKLPSLLTYSSPPPSHNPPPTPLSPLHIPPIEGIKRALERNGLLAPNRYLYNLDAFVEMEDLNDTVRMGTLSSILVLHLISI